MHLKEVHVSSDGIHFSHLLSYINGIYPNTQATISEFEQVLKDSIARVKETGDAVVINWAGHFDLLITEYRIHIIHVVKTFELPKIDYNI